jgi:hypothetical protein
MPRNDLRAALGEVPDHLFAGAVADLMRHELCRGSTEWVVRTSRQPASPAYVVWPDVIVEHERRVCAAITCKASYAGRDMMRSELIDPSPGKASHVRLAAVTREGSVHNLFYLVYGTPDRAITYHIDLPGLIRTTNREGSPETLESLRELVRSRRLRDVSRLPADLAA